jgi:hypothetical protein
MAVLVETKTFCTIPFAFVHPDEIVNDTSHGAGKAIIKWPSYEAD